MAPTDAPRTAPHRSLRGWLAHLAATGRLAVAREGVPLAHHLAAVAKRLDGHQAVCFPRPDGHAVPVVSGFMSRRAWIAEAMGVPESGLLAAYRAAAERPLASRLVPAGEAPCQQVVHRGDTLRDVRELLPVPTHSEHDNGPYITAGLVIARNPVTGVQNVSINRIQVHAPDRMAILMLPRHLHAFHQAAEARGEDLPVAVVIGCDPLTMLASQAIAPIDADELEIAGALHGEPLPVTRCLSNGVHVPAEAEIVIEGRILASVRELEGPFGEFPKYYSAREHREVIQVDAVTTRRDPVFHTIVPAEMEHLLLGSIPREATLLSLLQRSHPGVRDVHLSIGGVGRYHLHVKLRKTHEGQPRNVILCALGAHYDIKQVTVVDEDVDVHDPQQVEWAVATRFQADRDLIVAGLGARPLHHHGGGRAHAGRRPGRGRHRARALAGPVGQDGPGRHPPGGLSGARLHPRAGARRGRHRPVGRTGSRHAAGLAGPRMSPASPRRLVVAITGASGAVYGVRLLQALRRAPGWESHLILSPAGVLTAAQELDMDRSAVEALADVVHSPRDIGASVASGSFRTAGMVIAPCSMKTLSAIAHGLADNLVARAADVMLKERRRLVLMARETPLNLAHLRAMTLVTEMGGIVCPPVPAFYARPADLDAMVDHTVGRVLDLFDVEVDGLVQRWHGMGTGRPAPSPTQDD